MDKHLSVWWSKELKSLFININRYRFSLSFVTLRELYSDLVTNILFAIEIIIYETKFVDLKFLDIVVHHYGDKWTRRCWR